jgi:hypothetical protein
MMSVDVIQIRRAWRGSSSTDAGPARSSHKTKRKKLYTGRRNNKECRLRFLALVVFDRKVKMK